MKKAMLRKLRTVSVECEKEEPIKLEKDNNANEIKIKPIKKSKIIRKRVISNMETIILCTLFGLFNIVSYTLGLKNGQKLKNEEKIEMPLSEPINKVINNKISDDGLSDEDRISWENINNFDGTIESQKHI